MSYTALDLMREKNTHDFGRELGPFVPELPEAYKTGMDLKSAALRFLHERCEGLRFDAWDEYFRFDEWMACFAEEGVDPDFFALREMGEEELLPWDFIDCGVTKAHFLRERRRAYEGSPTRNCKEGCSGCGADRFGECLCKKKNK